MIPVIEWQAPDDQPSSFPVGKPVSLAIGVFDGVHRGHQELIKRTVGASERSAGQSWIISFDPNPARLTRPASYVGDLTTPTQRALRFGAMGVDAMLLIRFSPEFARVSGYRFLESLCHFFPRLETVVVGYNFHLGYRRDVHAEEASVWFSERRVRVDIVEALTDNSGSISSSRIRRAVAAGDLEQAHELLGRPYCVAVDGRLPSHRNNSEQVLPPAGTYHCTYHGPDHSREGMMGIHNDGVLVWERSELPISFVTLRRKLDGFDIRTEARDHR